MTDNFFTLHECQRCQSELSARIMSWFTDEVLCMSCHDKELERRKELCDAGFNEHNYEGCGYVPDASKESK